MPTIITTLNERRSTIASRPGNMPATHTVKNNRPDDNLVPLPQHGSAQRAQGFQGVSGERCPVVAPTSPDTATVRLVNTKLKNRMQTRLITAVENPTATPKKKPKSKSTASTGKTSRRNSTSRTRRTVEVTGPANPVIRRWRDLDELDKLKLSVRATQGHRGCTFSLNLSAGRAAGFAARENAMRGFQKRLSQAFKDHGLPMLPVAVQLEAARSSDRLHMHGVFIPQGHDVSLIQRALRQAAGPVRGRAGSRQCKSTPVTDSDGWTQYILKDQRHTGRRAPGRLTYINTPMKQLAQQLVEDERRLLRLANTNSPAQELPRQDVPARVPEKLEKEDMT